MSEEIQDVGIYEDDDEVLFDEEGWETAGMVPAGPAGFEVEKAEIEDRTTNDGDTFQVANLELNVIEHGSGDLPRGSKIFTNLSLDPQYIKQFKNLVTDGVGMVIHGPVTRKRLREMVAALQGQTFYGVIKHKDGFTNLGYKFADSLDGLKQRKKK